MLPSKKEWFKALELTQPENVKCVILGQDPYPTKGHANGLAFSVYPHVRPLPGSLANLFSEYRSDLGYDTPRTGDLTTWAEHGVLLLNTILTVEEGEPLSHEGIGWEKLSFEIMRTLADEPVVFLLMGKKAQEFSGAVHPDKTVSVYHPSPRSAGRGFYGSKPFTQVNEKLVTMGRTPIDWKLP